MYVQGSNAEDKEFRIMCKVEQLLACVCSYNSWSRGLGVCTILIDGDDINKDHASWKHLGGSRDPRHAVRDFVNVGHAVVRLGFGQE